MRKLILSAGLLALGITAPMARAEGDGFYNVSYNDIGLSLTQIGGYGELVIEPNGFADMAYGNCTVNFTRDATGAVQEMAPMVQGNSANCPSQVGFSLQPGENGMAKIVFTEGGALAGQSFDLFPVLLPMSDDFAVAAPKGFDILGMTIGQTRAEIEAILTAEGFAPLPDYIDRSEYTDGSSQTLEIWGKGVSYVTDRDPEDAISITYTRLLAENGAAAAPERVEVLGRVWMVPPAAQLSVANLNKSLIEKHGPLFKGNSAGLYYDRSGTPMPESFMPVCDESIHLQSVILRSRQIGMGQEEQISAGCGAEIKVHVMESFETKGMAGMLRITLYKGDLAYESFWNSWSADEAKALEQRYNMQAGMTGSAPKL